MLLETIQNFKKLQMKQFQKSNKFVQTELDALKLPKNFEKIAKKDYDLFSQITDYESQKNKILKNIY